MTTHLQRFIDNATTEELYVRLAHLNSLLGAVEQEAKELQKKVKNYNEEYQAVYKEFMARTERRLGECVS